jgi:flagellin-like protein
MKQKERMGKEGISPLIATVLLIGFAVALAAVVMTWGLDFIRDSTSSVGDTTEEALTCATKLDFEIVDVNCGSNLVTVENNGAVNMTKLTFRVYKGGDIEPIEQDGIGSLGVKQYTLDPPGLSGATKIEAIASVAGSSGDSILCKDASEAFTIDCP